MTNGGSPIHDEEKKVERKEPKATPRKGRREPVKKQAPAK